jgi:DNA primase
MQDHRIEGVGEIDAEDLLALLDVDNTHDVGSEEIGFSCLYGAGHANGDQNPSAHINRDSLLWRCKGCGRAGNVIELVKIGLPIGTTYPAALAWLRENFGEQVRAPLGGSLLADLEQRLAKASYKPPEQRLPKEDETIGPTGIFSMNWRSGHEAAVYMRGRNFAPEVLEDWGLGYDHWTRRVTIPIRDESGTLLGFKGRSIDLGAKVKYMLLGDREDLKPRYGVGYNFDMHDHRKVLFGIERAKGYKRVVIPEGELDAIACHSAGVPAVAPGTKSIGDGQLWLLRAHFDEIVFAYDAGDGDKAVWGYTDPRSGKYYPGLAERLSPYFSVYVAPAHEGDPASMEPQQVRDLVAGAKHWISFLVPSETPV